MPIAAAFLPVSIPLPSDRPLLARVLDAARILLWSARVKRVGDNYDWQFQLSPESQNNPLLDYSDYHKTGYLWRRENAPDFQATEKAYRDALASGANRYQQQFRIVRGAETLWLEELTGIEPVGPDEWLFTGIIRDVTERRLAEEAERQATAVLHRILENADCLLWHGAVFDDGSPNFAWQLTLAPSGMQKRVFDDLAHGRAKHLYDGFDVPQMAENDARAIAAMINGASGYEQEFAIIRRRDGQTFWIREHVVITPDGARRWKLSGVMIDVTARKLAELAQRDSELQLRHLLERVDVMVWQAQLTPTAGGYAWFISAPPSMLYRRLFNREPVAPLRFWTEQNTPDFAEMDARWRRALAEQQPGYEQEFRYQRDGELFWLHEQVNVLRREGGEIHLAGVLIDITARKLAELQLSTEKERLAVTLRAMDEAVATIGLDGEILFLNRAAEELLQVTSQAALGRPLAEIARLEIGRPPELADWPLDAALRDGQSINLPADAQLARASGAPVRLEGCIVPLRDRQSGRQGAVLVLRDVTERHLLQAQVQRASNLESIGLLAGGIAHDFNNILTATTLNLSLAQTDVPAGSPLAEHLREARAATDRAAELARQLLTFSKGGDPLLSAVNLAELIEEVTRFALRGARVEPVFEFARDLWPAKADRGQLSQIVQNLVLNAMQSMPNGGTITLRAKNDRVGFDASSTLAPGDYVRISVSDTGLGIAPEALDKIFNPYFTTKKDGHGLGLAVVYSILKKHRGTIDVRSAVGVGTTFELLLPAAHETVGERRADTPVRGTLQGRVLIMDDEPAILRVLTVFLQRLGLQVEASVDGADAVQRYRTAFDAGRPHDLLVMDLTVPGKMGGREAMAAIRGFDPNACAIVASGYSSDPVMSRFSDYGFRAVAPKPYDMESLARLIAELLAQQAGRAIG